MKLSKILITPNLNSITLNIYDRHVLAEIFTFNEVKKIKRTTRTYKTLDIDERVLELPISSVKHLGINRYRKYAKGTVYVNIYNY